MEEQELSMFQSTVRGDGEVIFIKPLCDFFEIDPENQGDKIKSDPVLSKSSGKKPSKVIFNDNYPRIYLTKKGFVRWIQLINPNTVREDLQEKFMIYQEMVFDYCYGSAEQNDQLVMDYARKDQLSQIIKDSQKELKTVNRRIDNYLQSQARQLLLPFQPLSKR